MDDATLYSLIGMGIGAAFFFLGMYVSLWRAQVAKEALQKEQAWHYKELAQRNRDLETADKLHAATQKTLKALKDLRAWEGEQRVKAEVKRMREYFQEHPYDPFSWIVRRHSPGGTERLEPGRFGGNLPPVIELPVMPELSLPSSGPDADYQAVETRVYRFRAERYFTSGPSRMERFLYIEQE